MTRSFCRLARGRSRGVAVVVSTCLLLAGCGRPPGGYEIVVIPKGMTHEHWQSVHRGALRAADDLAAEGITVRILWDGPLRERDALEQVRIVDRRVATGVSGVVLAPQHSRIMSAPAKRAWEEHVPVVVIDSGLANRDRIVKYVATDNYHGGWMAAEHLWKVLSDAGIAEPRLVLLRYQVGSESTEQREQGFLDYFDPSNNNRPRAFPPPQKVIWKSTDQYAGATRDSASRAAAPLVQKLAGEIDAIFAPNESSASGTLDVLRSQQLNQKIRLMAFDSSKPLLQAIEEGDVIGSIIQDPYWMGYLGTWTVVRYLEGDDVNAGRKELDVSTGEYLVTKENVRATSTLEKFDPEVQKLRKMNAPRFPKGVAVGGS
jgi:ribose transport system substrate-binding protein